MVGLGMQFRLHPIKSTTATVATAATALSLAFMLGVPGTALATAGQYCGVYGTGNTLVTVWTKQPPGCKDLNIVYSNTGYTNSTYNHDYYAGYYEVNGGFVEGSRGYQTLYNGNHNPNTDSNAVPLTNVATGTKMEIITSLLEDAVHINY